MLDIKKFSENLIKHRKALGLSQRELADRLYVSMQAVSKWEKGLSVPGIDHLCALSDMFGLTLDDFICTKNNSL